MSESDTRFLDPRKRGAPEREESTLDLSAVEGSFNAEPPEGGGPKLVSRSWQTARLSVSLATAARARELSAKIIVNGKPFSAEIRSEGGGQMIVVGEFEPRSVPSGTHSVQVHVESEHGGSVTVDVGRVQVFGMMSDRAVGPTPTSGGGRAAETTATNGGEIALTRTQAAGAGVGCSVAGFVLGKIF